MNGILFSEKVDAKLSMLGIGVAILFLYLFGVHGFLRSAPFGSDFLIFHNAAEVFLLGENPWFSLKDTGEPFSYPPHIATLLLFYGALPAKISLGLHTLLNVLSIGVMVLFANKWFIGIQKFENIRFYQSIAVAAIIGNPFMAHSVFEGQITLPTCAAAILSWHFLNSKKGLLAGLFLGLASIKPQVAIFYILWLLLRLELKILMIGGAFSLLMMLPSLISLGPVDVFSGWFASMQSYSTVPVNQPGSPHVVGLESFFVAVGVLGSGVFVKLLSLVCIVTAFIYRQYFNEVLTLNLFFIMPLTFIFGHDTGYSAVMMFWSYFLFLGLKSERSIGLIVTLALTFGFFFPQRFLREIDIDALHHTRTFILIFAFAFAFHWSRTTNSRDA